MDMTSFIALDATNAIFLFLVGWVGGLVSGFIGSGGAFVLTPAMMSMGVPGIVAVASNMCHKFPKAMVGAMKRSKYGQVDWKLGIVLGISAEAGVLYGADLQETIKQTFGNAGSNLYVSVVFVVILGLVGGFVMRDAMRSFHGVTPVEEKAGRLAQWIYSIRIPGTMIWFPSIQQRVSFLITIPLGFATGLLAATIAVGGFVGVPAMIYVMGLPSLMASATELVVAFIMGLGGTFKFAWGGYVDLRLAMLILAGSLFGIQLGAIGTTYVKPYIIKLVMGTIMLTVLLSRALVIPVYLSELGIIRAMDPAWATIMKNVSFGIMILALLLGAGIILGSIVQGMRASRSSTAAHPLAVFPSPGGKPTISQPL